MRVFSAIICLVTGGVVVCGFFLKVREGTPRVLLSSISPDKKWICEIADVHPNPSVCLAVLHVQKYEGRDHLERGFQGAAYVQDYDSMDPHDIAVTWNGNEATVSHFGDTSSLTFRMTEFPAGSDHPGFCTSDLVKVER